MKNISLQIAAITFSLILATGCGRNLTAPAAKGSNGVSFANGKDAARDTTNLSYPLADSTEASQGKSKTEGQAKAPIIQSYDPRPDQVAAKLRPDNLKLVGAYKVADWQQVLDLANSLEAKYEAEGFPTKFSMYRAEAYIGLGRPEDAVRIYHEEVAPQMQAGDLTLALALAMTGQLDAADARATVSHSLRFMPKFEPGVVPNPVTRNQTIATVRTARAVEANSGDPDQYIIREAKEALRLDPTQRLAAYVLAQALNRKERYAEALPYWKQASSLPGTCGKDARVMAESTANTLRTTAANGQSGQGSGGM